MFNNTIPSQLQELYCKLQTKLFPIDLWPKCKVLLDFCCVSDKSGNRFLFMRNSLNFLMYLKGKKSRFENIVTDS